jgi:hypothetical protein
VCPDEDQQATNSLMLVSEILFLLKECSYSKESMLAFVNMRYLYVIQTNECSKHIVLAAGHPIDEREIVYAACTDMTS